MKEEVERFLQESVTQGVFPGVCVCAGNKHSNTLTACAGHLSDQNSERVSDSTCYDVASLTKVMATGVLYAKALAENKINLDDPANQYWNTTHPFTLRELLCHASGLPAWKPYYERVAAGVSLHEVKELYRQWIDAEKLVTKPGSNAVYSDLGYIVLGMILETLYQKDLRQLSNEKIFEPLALRETGFEPTKGLNVAPTEDCPFRKKLTQGIVHDLNAWALGGVAGHAGVFSTARNVASFARAILKNLSGEARLCPPKILQEFTRRQKVPPTSTWALSWDTPSAEHSSAGNKWSKEGFGHLGYTGCSLWLDPLRDFYVVCLSNRVYPTSKNELIRGFRPMLHDLLIKKLQVRS